MMPILTNYKMVFIVHTWADK